MRYGIQVYIVSEIICLLDIYVEVSNKDPCDFLKIAAMKAKTALRETARGTRENPSFMINNKKAELADSVQDHLGSDAPLKRMLQRERRKDTPKDPKKLADLVIEEQAACDYGECHRAIQYHCGMYTRRR